MEDNTKKFEDNYKFNAEKILQIIELNQDKESTEKEEK